MRTFRTFRVRLATCKICKGKYQRKSMAHVTCSTECAIAYVGKLKDKRLEQKAREIRKEIRERKEKLKTASDYRKEAQKEFNAWARERDKDLPCISCGREDLSDPLTGGAWDCGHYRGTGPAPHLRFDPLNVAKQCKRCNRDLSGNSVMFRRGLVERIGLMAVEIIEADNTVRRYRKEDYIAIRDEYRQRRNELKASAK